MLHNQAKIINTFEGDRRYRCNGIAHTQPNPKPKPKYNKRIQKKRILKTQIGKYSHKIPIIIYMEMLWEYFFLDFFFG